MGGEFFFREATLIEACSKMICFTVESNTKEKMVKATRDSGDKIRKMDLAYTVGLMEVNMKEITKKEKEMVMAS